MTEKIGLIKNPLTIIAIFAGIAEVSGTIVLPFIAVQNQVLFIWFLIAFPTVLILSFFATLNFNNKVLYAPSDYRDESNYLLSNKYNAATQSSILIKESYNDAFLGLEKSITELRVRVDRIYEKEVADIERTPDNSAKEEIVDKKSLYTYQVVKSLSNVSSFVRKMGSLGYEFNLYETPRSRREDRDSSDLDSQVIWLGVNVDLEIAKEVIFNAKKYFPFIKYIGLSSEDDIPREILNQIFVGGSTKSAVESFNLKPIDKTGFERIRKATSLTELHQIINSYAEFHYEQ